MLTDAGLSGQFALSGGGALGACAYAVLAQPGVDRCTR